MGSIKYEWYLYVLELENNKWYVGTTTDIDRRYIEHAFSANRGSKWTRKYKPIKVVEVSPLGRMNDKAANIYESAKTLDLMRKYGKDNVRGGCFMTNVSVKKIYL